jgi:CHASE3 domain sensor protein
MEAKRVAFGLGLVGLFLFTVAGRVYYKMRRGGENRQSEREREKERTQRSEVELLKESKSG